MGTQSLAPAKTVFVASPGILVHAVARAHDHRAQRDAARSVQPLKLHRHPKEAGCAAGLHARINLFEVAAQGFLAIVDAEDHLR